MSQSFRSLIYLWSAVLSISAVGAAALHAYGPVSPRGPEPEAVSAPAAASIQPIAATASRLAEAEEPADEPPTIVLASLSPAVLAAGITEVRKPPPAPAAPAAVPSQPVMASVAPAQPAPAPRAKAPARRPEPQMEAAFAPPPRSRGYALYAPTGYAPTGYIGVYTRGPDGMRVFQSYP